MTNGFDGGLPAALPCPIDADGKRRLIGIEIEFAGLSASDAAAILARATGGRAFQTDDGWRCETPLFGTCDLSLDTAWRGTLATLGGTGVLDLAQSVVPVELVTEPFDPKHLPAFDAALEALRDAGAAGSRGSLMHCLGVHLNVDAASLNAPHIAAVARAYALLEPLLRADMGLDGPSQALPFVDPYPEELTDALTMDLGGGLAVLADLYLRHTRSQHHGLDLLPLLAHALPDKVRDAVGYDENIAPRPAWHYRLPESRIDEPGGSISREWHYWCMVEAVAKNPACLSALCRAWARYRAGGGERDWVTVSRSVLDAGQNAVAA
ncbi:hypothetical protein GQ651_09655 [Alphaproteobacteria bacterium GH1-50]|uniref:Amidoligase enzyme n=1 Tax=Kangsaoukella pontilimi TaxID=2691042 RepID=A0A7C9IRZ5_9RHOB|nr:amidoligase family protein [Kangsaoukella pontilimi]MXQ08106.1 hypothetical protein [Kangsaoukella pontilimi]